MTSQDARTADPMVVECDVYSGRPNPTWPLRPADATALDTRLRALPAQRGPALPAPDLGYRGLRVRVGTGARAIVVARGTVTVTDAGTTTTYRDEARALELWLLDTGRGHVDAELLDYVAAEIRREAP